MKKRLLALFLAVALVCALLPATLLTASAATYSGACGENLTWTLDTETGVLTISGTGEMSFYGYSGESAPWYSYLDLIKSVIICDGVTSIGDNAFRNCATLTSVTITDSVEIISYGAFSGCTALTSIVIPDSVTSIGAYAFYDTAYYNDDSNWTDDVLYIANHLIEARDSLAGVYYVKTGTKTITDDAFEDCTGLTNLTIPNSVTSIGEFAFHNCTGLTSIAIPDSVTSIDFAAFAKCTGLTSITIGNGVTSIGVSVFSGCTGLTSITIPGSVTSIDAYAFSGCTGLMSITIPDSVTGINRSTFDNTGYYNDETNWTDGVLYIGKYLIVARNSLAGAYSVSSGTKTIAEYAFYDCTGLTSVTIPDSVTIIGDGAFNDCTGLTSVMIGSGVTSIGNHSFNGCTGLTNVTIPGSVTSISEFAFRTCTSLKSITIPDSVTEIGRGAFENCTALTSIAIPDSVTSIGDWAFYDCSSLTSVTIGNGVTSIGWYAFYGCTELMDVYYLGTAAEWSAITIDSNNECLINANIHFGSAPACEHDHAHPEHKDATCTEPGYDRMICDDCGEVISEKILPALGHSFKDSVCTRCGAKEHEPVSFNDVSPNAWYYGAVDYAVSNGLMNGVGGGNFAPDSPMTRAMLVTVLWRYEGEPKEGKNTFTDVPDGQWYTQAVAWAAANGIVGGVGNGKFDPNGNITREQMAAILFRYAEKKGFDTTARGDLSKFPDAGKVSSWAKDAIAWAVAEGIIGGSDGKLLPQGNATRAQVSTILMRFIENIAKK